MTGHSLWQNCLSVLLCQWMRWEKWLNCVQRKSVKNTCLHGTDDGVKKWGCCCQKDCWGDGGRPEKGSQRKGCDGGNQSRQWTLPLRKAAVEWQSLTEALFPTTAFSFSHPGTLSSLLVNPAPEANLHVYAICTNAPINSHYDPTGCSSADCRASGGRKNFYRGYRHKDGRPSPDDYAARMFMHIVDFFTYKSWAHKVNCRVSDGKHGLPRNVIRKLREHLLTRYSSISAKEWKDIRDGVNERLRNPRKVDPRTDGDCL